tara:strand:- start:89 stop:1081 length:993 start_codon:yes stop_codon:yes gene_type:complete
MVICRTPFRVSFIGGGSDLKSFYKHEPGCVISTSIDKYMYLSMHKYFHDNQSIIKYSSTEKITSINEIKHDIIREVFRLFSIKNVDFNSIADIPAGTGMASSSAFTVALINLCSAYLGHNLPNHELAKLACEVEIEILKEPIGKQDQYGCALGGLNFIQFNPDDSVEVKPIFLSNQKINMMNDNLLLFYTNIDRSASKILKDQNKNTIESKSHRDNLRRMTFLTKEMYNEFLKGNVNSLGHFLNESWKLKQSMSSKISNQHINDIYKIAMNNGADGGKLLGAGGGGFFLFYCEKEKQEKLRKSLLKFKELKFKFDYKGSSIIFNDNKNEK